MIIAGAVFAIPETLTNYLARTVRYPWNVTEGERELIDALDAALRSLQTSRVGPYGVLCDLATTVLDLIEDREPVEE